VSIQEIMSMKNKAVPGLLTGSKPKAAGLDFNRLIEKIITSQKEDSEEECSPFISKNLCFPHYPRQNRESEIYFKSDEDAISLITGMEFPDNLNEIQNYDGNSEMQKNFINILNQYVIEGNHVGIKEISDTMTKQLNETKDVAVFFEKSESNVAELIGQWLKEVEKDGLTNYLTQDENKIEDLPELLKTSGNSNGNTTDLLTKREVKDLVLQDTDSKSQKQMNQISEMDLSTKQKENTTEALHFIKKTLEFVKSEQEPGKTAENLTATSDNSMMKLKEQPDKLINVNAAAENKDIEKAEDFFFKIHKNPEIVDKVAHSLSDDDSAQFQKENYSGRKMSHEKTADIYNGTKTEDAADHFKISTHKSVEMEPVVKGADGQEILSQNVKVNSSNSNNSIIKNWGDIQIKMSKEIGKMGEKGKSALTVRLQPEELGRMKIEIELKDGTINGKIYVENESSRNAIQQNIQAMRTQMKEQGIAVGNLEVDIGNGSFENFESQQETMKEANLFSWTSANDYETVIDDFGTEVDRNKGTVNRLNALA